MDHEYCKPVLEEHKKLLAIQNHIVLDIRTRPSAHVSQVRGVLPDGSIKIDVAGVPEAGRANKALLALLAREFDVPITSVELTSGHTSTRKRVHIVRTVET